MQLDTQKHEVSQYLRSAHANRHAEARVSRCMNTRHAEGQVAHSYWLATSIYTQLPGSFLLIQTHQGHSKTWLREREKEVRCFRSIDIFRRPINWREVPKDCPEEKEGSFRVMISPDEFIQDIEVGFWDLTSRYQDGDLEGIKGVGQHLESKSRATSLNHCESRVYLVLVLLCENLVVVLVVVYRSLLPQIPPASPIEDRGTAILIEDRGTAIPIEDRDQAIPERLRLCGIGNPGSLSETSSLTPHILLQVTSRKDHSARGTVGAGVD
ncbi:hypothetical protein F2Q69_00027548 [Brassica cretica]|uniref:Uncharacterized protein n=1 Tax=Brassica cretica TaxID=69181 RepID=A0A8S9RUS1_BRACR|nr:hypothetical protein F2Q69_00027548 [Brassica cretica]